MLNWKKQHLDFFLMHSSHKPWTIIFNGIKSSASLMFTNNSHSRLFLALTSSDEGGWTVIQGFNNR